ncbi:MAG: acyl-CoA dehydrogenase [Paraglaciecola sp.]|jgi:acyl-CoA dehydrogenase
MNLDTYIADIQQTAAAKAPIGKTLKFNMGGQILHIDGTGDTNKVSQEDQAADCTISVSQEDFIKLVTGKLNPMMAFMGGKIKVDGDMSVAMKLQSLF